MTREEKQLLLQDLSARLPYGVKIQHGDNYKPIQLWNIAILELGTYNRAYYNNGLNNNSYSVMEIKPYLRPLSSMTKEERKELNNQGYAKIAGEFYHYCALSSDNAFYNPERHPYVRMEYVIKLTDWLNAHHFDYRGLIEKGLALEALEGMYNFQ